MLADVFEKFRNSSLQIYGLCSSHYWSAPGLSWNVIVKMTKVELELITDPDKFIFSEKGARGKIYYISNRYSKANNRYLKSVESKQKPKYV